METEYKTNPIINSILWHSVKNDAYILRRNDLTKYKPERNWVDFNKELVDFLIWVYELKVISIGGVFLCSFYRDVDDWDIWISPINPQQATKVSETLYQKCLNLQNK